MKRNQTEEHQELAKRCLTWAAARATGRGIRGATEVRLDEGYQADAMVIGSFQWRWQEAMLGAPRMERIEGTLCAIVPEVVCVFEVKVSRADFLSTFGPSDKHANRREPVATLHYIVTPQRLVSPDELPGFWGLLEKCGAGLREAKAAEPQEVSDEEYNKRACQILWALTPWRQRAGEAVVCPAVREEGA